MKTGYVKMTGTGNATTTEGCLYGWCLKSNGSGAGTVTIADGTTEILYDTTSAATTSHIVFLKEPLQFDTNIAISAATNLSYITLFIILA